mgnify:CR=1 FL=1
MHRHFRLPALAALFLTGAFSVWAADTPVKGGTLIYLEQQPHTNLYPPAGGFYPNGGILNQITDKLTWQNPKTLEIEPWIAESWTSNADKTEYTFHLRKGVTFSDGTPLDAAAVAKNFDTYGLGDKAHRLPVSEVINNYQRSEVIDPLTVKFYFNKPSPGFLQGTATIGSGLVSLSTLQRNFEELGDARHIIGSGPFVVQDEKPGRELTLVARKDYQWGPKNIAQQGPANLDGITYIVTPEDSVRIGALLAGQAGFIRQVQAYDEKQATDQGFKIYAAPTRGVNDSLSFRPDNPLVADLRVRQALLHATNARQVVETLFSANYPQATSVLASSAAGYVNLSDKLTFDQAKARQLLDDAGWTECQISVSNSLDEYLIQDLLLQDAKIDLFGVGERMLTSKSDPVFGGVYKLAAIEKEDGTIVPKIKISENVGKITNPHFKKVYRIFDKATGKAEADYITVWDEVIEEGQPLELFDPDATWKRRTYTDYTIKPLQEKIFDHGELVYQQPTLPEIQKYCREQIDTLWDEVKRFENPHNYYVDLSQKLWDIKQDLLRKNYR